MRRRLLHRISRWIAGGRNPIWILSVGLLLALSALLASRPTVRINYLDLFGRGDRLAQDYLYALRNFGGVDFLLIGVESEETEKTRRAVDRLSEEIGGLEGVEYCLSRIPPEFFLRNSLMLLEYDELRGLVADEGPLLNFLSKIRPGDGYFVSQDGRMFLLKVKPRYSSEDMARSRELLQEIDDVITRAFGELEVDRPKAVIAGPHREVLEDATTIQGDVRGTASVTFVAVLLILWAALRRWSFPLLAGLTLAVGLAMTLAFAGALWGRLTLLTAVFPAVLMGLGIDHAIHLFARMEEGDSSEDALTSVGPALITGGLTTSAAFYSLTFSRLQGLREMGVMGGTGVLFLLLSSLLLLPSLHTLMGRRRGGRREGVAGGFGPLRGLADWVIKRRRAVLVAGSLLLVLSGYSATKIDYQVDWREIRAKDQPSSLDRDYLFERFGLSPDYAMVVAEGLEDVREATAHLRRLGKEGSPVGEVVSIADYIPEDQEEKLRLIAELKERLMRWGLSPLGAYLRPEDLPPEIRQQFIGRDGRYLIYVYPREFVWDESFAKAFVREIEEAIGPGDGYIITGGPVLYSHMLSLMKADFRRCSLVALAAIALILFLDFRDIRVVALSLLPLLSGAVFMLGTMGLLGLSFNFVNILVTPMILGIGIDDGVHLVHRVRWGREGGVSSNVARVGKPIAVTSLTTMAAFGSFLFSRFQGLRTMGLTAALGIGYCMVFSLTLLPAVLSFLSDPEDLQDRRDYL